MPREERTKRSPQRDGSMEVPPMEQRLLKAGRLGRELLGERRELTSRVFLDEKWERRQGRDVADLRSTPNFGARRRRIEALSDADGHAAHAEII